MNPGLHGSTIGLYLPADVEVIAMNGPPNGWAATWRSQAEKVPDRLGRDRPVILVTLHEAGGLGVPDQETRVAVGIDNYQIIHLERETGILYGHLPTDYIGFPNYWGHFMLMPALALQASNWDESTDYARSLGARIETEPASIGINRTVAMDFGFYGRVTVRYWFESDSHVLPRSFDVLEWGLEWPLQQSAFEVSITPQPGALLQYLPKPKGPPPVIQPQMRTGWTEYGTVAGERLAGPVGLPAWSAFPLEEAADAAARDPRVQDFLRRHPNAFLGAAVGGWRDDRSVFEWSLTIREGCPDKSDRTGQVVWVSRPPSDDGSTVAVVSAATEAATLCGGRALDLGTLPTEMVTPAALAASMDRLGIVDGIDFGAGVGFSARATCDPASPWVVQVGHATPNGTVWLSMVDSGILARITSSVGTSGFRTPLSACPPNIP